MKRILMSTAIIAALSTGAYAETAQTDTQAQPSATAQAQVPAAGGGMIFAKISSAESVKGDVKASTLIGKDIYIPKPAKGDASDAASAQASAQASADGSASVTASKSGEKTGLEDIGAVSDVILSQDGKVDAVLVDVGGFLGIGSHTVALDWSALHWKMKPEAKTPADSYLVVDATKKQLEKAPEFKDAWLAQGARAASEQTASDQAASDQNRTAGDRAADAARSATDSVTAAAQSVGQKISDATSSAKQKIADMSDGSDQSDAQNMSADSAASAQPKAEAGASVGGAVTGPIAKAEKDGFHQADIASLSKKQLTGATVYDAKGDDAGTVSKVITGASSNEIEGAVVKVGGFLGIGEKTVEVKAQSMKVMTKDNGKDVRIYVSLTEQQLKQMPTYKQG